MPSIAKPRVAHPSLKRNDVGLTVRDYEGSMSTLCAGCGHDSITAGLIRALWELSIPPHMIAKMSGIGCSSKTPTYFVGGAHGFNSAHGRMPAIATGANAANKDLTYIGISGDGDSLSIGLGHLCHAIRRNLNMLYVIENNGVYGLTKGQFSASADVGSKSKKGEANLMSPIDPVQLALSIGATFVARSFSGGEEDPYKTVFEPLSRRPSGAWRDEQDRGDGKMQGARLPLIGGDFAAIEAGLLGTAGHDGAKIHFRQSSFEGANVSSRTLRRHAVDHIPVLTAEGEAERFLLGAMDGRASLEEIAKKAAVRFPEVYSSHEEALERVSELARKFSR